MAYETPEQLIDRHFTDDKGTCPFCGSPVLYDAYHVIDGFPQLMRFCNSCKTMFTIEGLEDDYDTGGEDFRRLDAVFKATRKTYEDWNCGRN